MRELTGLAAARAEDRRGPGKTPGGGRDPAAPTRSDAPQVGDDTGAGGSCGRGAGDLSRCGGDAQAPVPPWRRQAGSFSYLDGQLERVLIDADTIAGRVAGLGREIGRDYQGLDLLVVGVLKGAMMFLADLIRHIHLPLTVDYVAVSSYGSGTGTSGAVRILKDLDMVVEGRHVLLVEDIVDSGLTLSYLYGFLQSRAPASLRVCALLDKPSRRRVPLRPDYCGFEVPDVFVVGYGLDYNEKYRHLPFIAVLRPQVYAG